MRWTLHVIVAIAAAVPLLAVAIGSIAAPKLYEDEMSTPFDHREATWVGSTTCQACHPDQHASWQRTFHRTMTQVADPHSVAGAFDAQVVTYGGVPARPVREGDQYFFEYLDADTMQVVQRERVVLTVGSRRYQQYMVAGPEGARGENLYRAPLLWHIGDQRWIHINGAFLDRDGTLAYDSNTPIWNQTCIFCHNTGPQPGMLNYDDLMARADRGEAVDILRESRYLSDVAEYGISCESCHAPGSEHAARNRNPLRRYLLHATDARDPTIVHPEQLNHEREVEVCGQCHGQRIPNPPRSIETWMTTGPSYRAGDQLLASVSPVSIETPGLPGGDPDNFLLRFWADGTPRLTAYEYQGITMSRCYLDGTLTCTSCHSMHGGDIEGQIEPAMRTNQACASCHDDLVASPSAHTRHRADNSGSYCYSCHMPKVMYGVLEIHRTHRIHNPNPANAAEYARPDACTNCHLDKSLRWAAMQAREWWGTPAPSDDTYRVPSARADGAPIDLADTVAALLAGDPVQRAVAARLAGRRDTPLDITQRAFLWPVLLTAMDDEYPTIRYFARNSLRALDEEMPIAGFGATLEAFDYLATPAERQLWTNDLWRRWRQFPKDGLPVPSADTTLLDARYEPLADRVAQLTALQSRKQINIGE